MRYLKDYTKSWKKDPLGQTATGLFMVASGMLLYTGYRKFQKSETYSTEDYFYLLVPSLILVATSLLHINNVKHTRNSNASGFADNFLRTRDSGRNTPTQVLVHTDANESHALNNPDNEVDDNTSRTGLTSSS